MEIVLTIIAVVTILSLFLIFSIHSSKLKDSAIIENINSNVQQIRSQNIEINNSVNELFSIIENTELDGTQPPHFYPLTGFNNGIGQSPMKQVFKSLDGKHEASTFEELLKKMKNDVEYGNFLKIENTEEPIEEEIEDDDGDIDNDDIWKKGEK